MKKPIPKKDLKAPTKWFHELLRRASQPLSEEEARKEKSETSGDYTSKRTRQRKAEDAEG